MGASQVHRRPIRTALVTQQPLTGIEMVVLSVPLLLQQTVLVTRRQPIKMPMVVTLDLRTATQTASGIPIRRIPMAMADIQDRRIAIQIVLEIQRPPIVIAMARQLVHRQALRIRSETRP